MLYSIFIKLRDRIQSDRVGDEVVFIFKFNCGKCSVILQDLPPELPLNFLGFIKKLPCMQASSMLKVPAISTRVSTLFATFRKT